MDRRNKIILLIMVVALILGFNIHQIRTQMNRQDIAAAAFTGAGLNPCTYMEGIDFSKRVHILKVKKGDVFIQYQVPGGRQGNFYGLQGSTPTQLGINDKGIDPKTQLRVKKKLKIYMAVKDFRVLSSYAAEVLDNWSTPEDESRTEGHKQQFFTACKPCFERVYE